MKSTKSLLALSCLLAVAGFPCAASASDDQGWQWVGAPYLWASSITTDLRDEAEPVPSTSSFSSIISKLDMAFQGHFEGQGERFGVFADVTYIALSDDHSGNVFDASASLDTTLTELAAVWNVSPARYEGLDVFAGVRHINADLSVQFESSGAVPFPPVSVGFDQSFTDFMLGVRYSAPLSDKWKLITRIDGAWGDTDGTINASALLSRKFSKGSLLFGYRYMDIELAGGDESIDVTMHGPMLAFAFGL